MTAEKKRSGKQVKLSGREQVMQYLNALEHPLKAEIEAVRAIILSANEQITEHIKWNAPSFCIDNQDRITFNLHRKDSFQLIFHCGAKVIDAEGQERLFEDETGLLGWITNNRAAVKFTGADEVEDNKEKLKAVVNRWIEVTRESAG